MSTYKIKYKELVNINREMKIKADSKEEAIDIYYNNILFPDSVSDEAVSTELYSVEEINEGNEGDES